jgi:hypothetical protein
LAIGILFAVPVWADDDDHHDAPSAVHGDLQSDMMMYALLEMPPPPRQHDGAELMQRLAPFANRRIGGRPMLLWYHWANERKRFFPAFAFLLFTSILISSCAPRWMTSAQGECKHHFWKSFLQGLLMVALGITAVRAGLVTMIGWPMAVLLAGLLQIALLGGLSCLILLIGQAFGHYLRLEKWITRPDVRRLTCIVIGCLLIALMLQIPGVATLPRIGTRLVAMLAIVGLGGLFRSRRIQPEAVQ